MGGPGSGRPKQKLNKWGMAIDYEDGMSTRQVREKYGCGRWTVLDRLHECDVKIRATDITGRSRDSAGRFVA